jgi:hypothetical protein
LSLETIDGDSRILDGISDVIEQRWKLEVVLRAARIAMLRW